MKRLVVDHGSATDVGLVREVNEDSLFAEEPVFVVADGMGGHDGGDVASGIAVQEFARLAGRSFTLDAGIDAIVEALRSADTRISEYAAGQRARGQLDFHSGTTVVAALVVEAPAGPQWLIANLGDSRIYRFFEGALTQLSVDHSLVQELVDAGTLTPEQAEKHPDRHVITRALGGVASAVPDFFHMMLPPGSRVLLCSDGVSGMIGPTAIAEILGRQGDARDAARRLVDAAVAAGGRDNATAVVVDVVGWADESPYDAVVQRQSLEQKLGVLP
ncbi:PP2C family protein-serine/threonine phosphatase [Nocardioides sp. Iso805N]|uniref:PP2C family protein-serine/threonine phosphatase n=1 Tax=Nocardioides sp. Iso805N TaxID=1283287 RepID=UPI00037620CC|nr:protein phosphatase 2C domain-containing protein [Nocardioides sp. Iso805N]